MRLLLAVILVSVLMIPSLRAADGDRIYSALILANKESSPGPVPKELASDAAEIKEIFGFNSLYLLGDKKKPVSADSWLVPSDEFFFKVNLLKREETRYVLEIELYQQKKQLLSAKVCLAKDAPLYIRGPQWGKGRLVLLLKII